MENIPQKLKEVLEVLAEKFGTTGELLWKSLLEQQKIEAVFSNIGAVLFGILTIASSIGLLNSEDWWMFVFFIAPIGLLITLSLAKDYMTQSQNPTYSAIESILNLLKKDE